MIEAGQLSRTGKGRAARYRARREEFQVSLSRSETIEEDRVWGQVRSTIPRLAKHGPASAIYAYAFTEMLNNAIDHSGSRTIDVRGAVDPAGGAARFSVIDQTIASTATAAVPGTTVRFEVALDTSLTPKDVFERYSHDFAFDTSRVVVKLFERGGEFVSRSEAKRVVAGLERFREVVVDFHRVASVGQAFADEIFRVWARTHPETKLVPERMVEPVAFMVERARRAASAK